MQQTATSITPGKMILSGEHAVVAGNPALACSIQNNMTIHVQSKVDSGSTAGNTPKQITVNQHTIGWQQLQKIAQQIEQHYELYQQNKLVIQDVLVLEYDLLHYSIYTFFKYTGISMPAQLEISVSSQIPCGQGQGSSAAIIVGIMRALGKLCAYTWQPQKLLTTCIQLENLQHGKSSGLDIQLSLNPGTYLYENKKLHTIACQPHKFYIIYTGEPNSSTGQCVTTSQKIFAQQPHLLNAFEKVTMQTVQALQDQDKSAWHSAILKNQILLEKINIVPQHIKTFIHNLKQHGIAAKICGAGSCKPGPAGCLLALCLHQPQVEYLTSICRQHNFGLNCFTLGADLKHNYPS